MEGFSPAQRFEVVDCLFPGQVKAVGSRVYMTPRRPGRTTVSECALRGGEFTIYDRVTNSASLKVWLPQAEGGDPEAQTYVGMLYEKGIDGEAPNYSEAVKWYQAAADQGYGHGQYSLGALYERGLGVEKDMIRALNLYREASGVSNDNVIFESNARKMIEAERVRLTKEIEKKGDEIEALQAQISGLRDKSGADQQMVATLQGIVDRFESERESNRRSRDRLPPIQPSTEPALPPLSPAEARRLGGKAFGRYHALVIGVRDYTPFPPLVTVTNDLDRAERVLRDRYGFSVTRLDNPSRDLVLEHVNQYKEELGENDNLLIYFAGHGEVQSKRSKQFGFWLPTDADAPPNSSNWIANDLMTDHLALLDAKRVLVVSDSIYIDMLESSPGHNVYQTDVSRLYLDMTLDLRSRLLLSSGTEKPVAASNNRYSRFASAFLDVLESNNALMHVPGLYRQIMQRLDATARLSDSVPKFRTIKSAGHALGDFFFVPSSD